MRLFLSSNYRLLICAVRCMYHKFLLAQLRFLDSMADQLLSSGFSAGTLRTRKSQWDSYYAFCSVYKFSPMPASPRQICLFATYLWVHRHLAPASVTNYVASLKSLHLLHKFPVPPISDPSVSLTLAGIRRRGARPARQATPISLSVLRKLVAEFDSEPNSGYRAAFVVAFFGFLRKSNVVPSSSVSASASVPYVRRGDFTFTDWGILLRIRQSKQRNFGDSPVVLPFFRHADPFLCPVAACQAHFASHPAPADSPAFLTARCGPITHDLFVCQLRAGLARVGISGNYSGHSFRRGGATLAANLSVSDAGIQLFGDWSSDAFKRYISSSLRQKTDIAQALASACHSVGPD